MKKDLFLLLMFLPMIASAQNMAQGLVKKTGVIVLMDKDVNPKGNSGNMVVFRLKDKSRPSHKKNVIEIQEHNASSKTRKISSATINPIDFEVSDSTINLVRLIIPQGEANFYINKTGKGLEVFIYDDISDSSKSRTYEIERVLFYRTITDIPLGEALGEEWNPYKAFEYLQTIFKPYR